ncbi:MAG: polyphenol oxidase family protein [Ilumatobacteraceae bacterium]
METIFRRVVGDAGRCSVVVATGRAEGDVHLRNTEPDTLEARQRRATGRRWAMADQVHGTGVHAIDGALPESEAIAAAGRVHADVLATDAPTVPLAIWTADCAPVVLLGVGGAVVAFHAGWRGLAAGIVDGAMDELAVRGDTVGAAVLGPVIHPCCYSFGAVELALVADRLGCAPEEIAGTTTGGEAALDMPAAVAAALARHEVELDVVGPCTACDERWYSHRRGDTERQALVTWSEVTRGDGIR